MRETYIRPLHKSIGIYFLIFAVTILVCLIISFLTEWLLIGESFVKTFYYVSEDMRWGWPMWLFLGMFLGILLGSIAPIVVWKMLNLCKYDL